MRDLSALAVNSITATSQSAGGGIGPNDVAMTAPGTPPVDPMPGMTDQADPHLQPIDHARVATERPHQAYDPAPFGSGTSWSAAGDDAGQSAGGWVVP